MLRPLGNKYLLPLGQQILASLLLTFHVLIWIVESHIVQGSLTLVLYGLFLLWQPLWDKSSPIAGFSTALLLSVATVATWFFPDEALVFFGLVMCGLIGSRLLSETTHRPFDLLAILVITLEIVVGLIPRTFAQITTDPTFAEYMEILILVPILLFFVATNPQASSRSNTQIDLMHGLLSSVLIFLVTLGGIVVNLLYGVDYIEGILLTVFIVSTLTLGISWFWNPGVGYTGIRALWNRYALTIGGPFESWINTLTTLIEEQYLSPIEFLQTACDRLIENDWLNGIDWQFGNYNVRSGQIKGTLLEVRLTEKINVMLYFKSNPGKALEQHTVLLVRMAYQFYLAKKNQEKMRAQEHFATIHHTGARLTHDIKNILQSIKTSLGILSTNPDFPDAQPLLEKNLSHISERLESTLEKLKAPNLSTQVRELPCQQWLNGLKQQHQGNDRLKIIEDIENNVGVPTDLFDGVADNLINNALTKNPTTIVEVRLITNTDVVLLAVCDDGEKIKDDIEADLFKKPVSSGQGMGIGLYQSAIMAQAFNYILELGGNESGKVCFNLYQHLGD